MMNKIDEFLLNFSEKKTKESYKTTLKKYFKVLDADPDTYFNGKRDYKADVQTFWQSQSHRPPMSIKTVMSIVKTFLEENDVELPKRVWTKIRKRTKGNRPLTMDAVPTNYELKKILQHGETKARALFLISSSSGMRIDEVLHLKPSDIDMNSDPVKITIPASYTKTNSPRISFMSNEAKAVLEEWLKVRNEYLQLAIIRTKNICPNKSTDDGTIFPFSYYLARKMWNRLITKAGFDERDQATGRRRMHIHSLRKYFRTRMSLEIPVDLVEAIMGHEGYLTEVYRRYDERQLGEMYKKGEHTVAVFETAIDTKDLDERIKEKDEEIYYLKKEMKTIKSEMGNFQKIIDDPHFRMEMMNMMADHWDMLQNKQNQK